MAFRIYVDGRITDARDAMVPVLDRGFLYGDGVYEVTRTAGGRPVDLEPHLDRLARSADRIGLALPPRDAMIAAIDATLADAGNPESYLRVIVTRGAGEMGLDPALADAPRLVVIVRPLALPAPALYVDGSSLRLVSVKRNSPGALDPAIKSGNYLNNILGLAEARRAGAAEAVMCDDQGRVCEGSSSNVWCVRGGVVATPPLHVGLLPGITRWRLLQLARADGVAVEEVELYPADLHAADELFITSSIRGVLPISRLDDRSLPVGPVTTRLVALYERFLADQAGRVAT
ncbi:MAG: aminotransferase class IV [Kofleriaceae bacterium]|nr:aminotransferase class IV [Myxococcales bacterium]MCB9563603.1 aminotransferase class IV [Kofleriaceae bacterium]MCB9572903.1 aminotransferase class IV [Kofleriaceae bacterium]